MYDSIVIGGGIVGSSAAYHLSRKGKRTLLLDQFHLPTTRGSSHGVGRIHRSSYANQLYAKMSLEALEHWKQLERETNTNLYRQTGMIVIDKPPFKELEAMKANNKALGVECEILSPEVVQDRYPGLVKISRNHKALLETNAGFLRADKALECLRMQIKKFGGQINDSEKVENILPGSVVTVTTEKGTYKTKSLIITPGPWICKLMKPLGLNLPIRVVKITLCYWTEKIPGQSKKYPTFCDFGIDKPDGFTEPVYVFGFPSIEYNGLRKISVHHGTGVDPDQRDSFIADETKDVQFLLNYMKRRFPEYGYNPDPAIIEKCMYSFTPDEDFIIDTLPGHPNIVYGCGFSGHGFKMAPVTGRVLGEMALGEKVSYDVSSLSMKRFPTVIASKY
ncbi:peroxisomal sarcosine oxidase-like isoform X2 [Apostichopus japonicus]|uniref:peroxisomal sarcosine oxidase-like isoform X2 n=1 Tax=Stichopus japonicus TaxID=307972 RepID=UPI003AB59E0C